MTGKRRRGPKRAPTPRRDGRPPLLPGYPGARNWTDVAALVETLDSMLDARNIILGELSVHLTDEHKARLAWPVDRLEPAVRELVRERGEPLPRSVRPAA